MRAYRLAAALSAKEVGGWTVGDLLHWGKSAAVFHATRSGEGVALKIFDDELIERFGLEKQLKRINRELDLVGHECDSLIKILDGGQCPATNVVYIVMELLDEQWQCLAQCYMDIPSDRIGPLISQVAAAAKWLEDQNLVHRDIKPQNIMVLRDYSKAKLLDLGVIRPIVASGSTDTSGKSFVGTLRYSPPEFLLRQENDDELGWRAVSFYQLGAVLHDLIVKKRLFEEFSEPFAKLIQAIQSERPDVRSGDVDQNIVSLCQSCLVKDPDSRFSLVSWGKFEQVAEPIEDSFELIKARVKQRQQAVTPELSAATGERVKFRNRAISEAVFETLVSQVRAICVADDALPTVNIRRLHQDDENTCEVLATFPQSPKFGIKDGLVLKFQLEMKNFQDQVCRIRGGYELTAELDSDANPIPDDGLETIFEGVFSPKVMENQLAQFIYKTFDKVQS